MDVMQLFLKRKRVPLLKFNIRNPHDPLFGTPAPRSLQPKSSEAVYPQTPCFSSPHLLCSHARAPEKVLWTYAAGSSELPDLGRTSDSQDFGLFGALSKRCGSLVSCRPSRYTRSDARSDSENKQTFEPGCTGALLGCPGAGSAACRLPRRLLARRPAASGRCRLRPPGAVRGAWRGHQLVALVA